MCGEFGLALGVSKKWVLYNLFIGLLRSLRMNLSFLKILHVV